MYVPVGECSGLCSSDGECTDRVAVPQHRHRQVAAIPRLLRECLKRIFRILKYVGDINHRTGENGPISRTTTCGRSWEEAASRLHHCGVAQIVMRLEVDQSPIEPHYDAPFGAAEPERTSGNRLKYRMD